MGGVLFLIFLAFFIFVVAVLGIRIVSPLSLIHISEPTRPY